MFPLNYIGSKKTLLPFITEVINPIIDRLLEDHKNIIIGDLFSGTGIVGQSLCRDNINILSNDTQYYSYVINKAALSKYSDIEKITIIDKIKEYNNLSGIKGFINNNYAPPLRMYFTNDNASKIDAIRIKLDKERRILGENVYYYLLANLISSADKVANTSAVYGAYLKKFKQSSQKVLSLKPFIDNKVKSDNIIKLGDASLIKSNIDIAYLDPPYNSRQYYTNYHLLETIARYDIYNLELKGKTGLRDDESQKSMFCYKNKAKNELNKLINGINSKYILLSYNNDGIINNTDIINILSLYGSIKIYKKTYKQFKAQTGVTDKDINEYLYLLVKN